MFEKGSFVRNATMWQYYYMFVLWLESLDTGDWMWVFGGAVLIGFLCLRGFGSRKNY